MGKRNSQLQELTVVAQNDYLTIVDTSAGQSKRVSVKTLVGIPELGWTAAGETWTYSSWNGTTLLGVITVPSNATTKYSPGMRVKITQATGGTKYGSIQAVSSTTLTVLFDLGTTFTNETISSPNFSIAAVPYGQSFIQPGQMGDSGWINVTFQNGWSSGAATVSYRKIGNIVYLRGQPTKSPFDSSTMFTLPAAFRPAQLRIFTVPGSSANYGKLVINPDGTVASVTSPSGGSYVGLDVVSYPVDQ